jgi:hypothetical protein
LHNAASNDLDVHDVKQLDPCGSHFQTSGIAPPRLARVRTRLSRRRGPCARASCVQHERCHDHSGVSCDNLGLFCPPAFVGGGVFLALPPVIRVCVTLVVRDFSFVRRNRRRTCTANHSVGSPAGRRCWSRYMSVSTTSVSLRGLWPSGPLVCHS